MTMELQWVSDEKRIIYWRFADYWTWAEYFQTIPLLIELASESQEARIDIICDLSESKHIPLNVIQNVQRGSPKTPDDAKRWGITVVVSGDGFVKATLGLLQKLIPFLGQHYYLAKNLDEAEKIILEHRQSFLPFV